MGEKLLQGENDGPVIFLQFDALFPGLPERRLWLPIDWYMRKIFGSIHLFTQSNWQSSLPQCPQKLHCRLEGIIERVRITEIVIPQENTSPVPALQYIFFVVVRL